MITFILRVRLQIRYNLFKTAEPIMRSDLIRSTIDTTSFNCKNLHSITYISITITLPILELLRSLVWATCKAATTHKGYLSRVTCILLTRSKECLVPCKRRTLYILYRGIWLLKFICLERGLGWRGWYSIIILFWLRNICLYDCFYLL